MASGLTEKDSMFSGERITPWHGMGKVVDGTLSSAEAIEASGLGWGVEKHPLFTDGGLPVPGMEGVVRDDTDEVIGVVGSGYVPLQNAEAFSFFDEIVGEGYAQYVTAGSLFGGRKVWLLAKMPQAIHITEADVVEQYLLLSSSHDGSTAVNVRYTPVRVVCNNTLSAALKGAKGFYARHTSPVGGRVAEAQRMLDLFWATGDNAAVMYQRMAEVVPSAEQVEKVLASLFPARMLAERDTWTKPRAAVMDLYTSSRTNVGLGSDGTAWSLYNSLTEFYQWGKAVKSPESRWASISDGYIAKQSDEAFKLCSALVRS